MMDVVLRRFPAALGRRFCGSPGLLLAGQMSVIEASRELAPLRHGVDGEFAEVLLHFAGIDSETDSLPIGGVRQYWNPESLKAKDLEIDAAERFYRDTAIKAATKLLRLLEIAS